jgi:hypothetical protein
VRPDTFSMLERPGLSHTRFQPLEASGKLPWADKLNELLRYASASSQPVLSAASEDRSRIEWNRDRLRPAGRPVRVLYLYEARLRGPG